MIFETLVNRPAIAVAVPLRPRMPFTATQGTEMHSFPRRTLINGLLLSLSLLLLSGAWSCAHKHKPTYRQELDFAVTAAKAGLWNEARFRFENLVRDQPANASAHNNLAVALEALGRYEEAKQAYNKALVIDPDNSVIKENVRQLEQILTEKAVKK